MAVLWNLGRGLAWLVSAAVVLAFIVAMMPVFLIMDEEVA